MGRQEDFNEAVAKWMSIARPGTKTYGKSLSESLNTSIFGFSVGKITLMFEEKDVWAIEVGEFQLFHVGNDHYICVMNIEEFVSMEVMQKKEFMDSINRFLQTPDVLFITSKTEPVFVELGKSESFSEIVKKLITSEVEKEMMKYLSSGR